MIKPTADVTVGFLESVHISYVDRFLDKQMISAKSSCAESELGNKLFERVSLT